MGKVETMDEINALEFSPEPVGWIDELVVTAHARRRGIAHALMQRMEEYLQSQSCARIGLEVYTTNPARELYASLGYGEVGIEMWKHV